MTEPVTNPVAAEPAPIRAARWFTTFASAMLSLVFLMAALNLGDFKYYDRTVTGPQFLALAGIPMGAFLGVFIALCLGLWLRLPWVRPVFLVSLAFGSVIGLVYHPGPPPAPGAGGAVTGLVLVCLCGWYLYGKTRARHYFDSLKHAAA